MPSWIGVYRFRLGYFIILVLFVVACIGVWKGYVGVRMEMQKRAAATLSWLLTGKIIVIDPGHGGEDSGVRGKDVWEKDVNLAIAKILAEKFRQGGAKVIMTRDDDTRLGTRQREDIEKRAAVANKNEADLMISIHANSFGDASQHGAQTFSAPQDAESKKLSHAIMAEIIKVLGNTDRKPKQCELYLFKHTKMPTVLIEVGFLTNPKERRLLQDSAYQDKLCFAIYSGVCKYFAEQAAPTTRWVDEEIIETFQKGPATPIEAP
ncbi:MAG: N-acetylmuramoyl-L-alanine amidase [Peptococcaceae bacterium]|nr:N-acetylmuramoyl-L-alanine amidase [Peptococcaceae bacterium]